MKVQLLKSKIHRAQITGGNLNYEGSLTIDRALMEKAGLLRHERILASNLANGQRFETYAIPGEAGSGQIILNGATSHLGKPGDRLTIMSFAWLDEAEARGLASPASGSGEQNKIINKRGRENAPDIFRPLSIPMSTAAQLARELEGEVLGDGSIGLTGFAPADTAKPGDLTFAENEAFFATAEQSAAAAILVDGPFTPGAKC